MNIIAYLNKLIKKQNQTFCNTALSIEPSLDKAVEQVCKKLNNSFNADLALIFISTNFASDYPRLLPLIKKKLKSRIWLGCSGGGVLGIDIDGKLQANENLPTLSVTLLKLPGSDLIPFHIQHDASLDLDMPSKTWEKYVKVNNLVETSALVFIDPTMDIANDLINTFDCSFPNSNIIGGIAGVNNFSYGSLFFEDNLCKGAVGVLIQGDWKLETLVTKGVKPIGPLIEVEAVNKNVLLKLRDDEDDLVSPIEYLQRIIGDLSEKERELLKKSIFLGVENRNMKITSNGKLLSDTTLVVRDLLGIDPINGAVAVSEVLKVGQKVQFQSRDINISRKEIEIGLEELINSFEDKPLLTVLLTCLGRGKSFYGNNYGDLEYAEKYIGSLPLCGGFFQGEIGKINGNSHLHGYSACWGFFVRNQRK